jgi:broad specificity phosphatase PhoE
MLPAIYLVRHATPDWSRTDLVYHLPPGPPLTPQGEHEAGLLGDFLRDMGVTQIIASPLERCQRTALLAAQAAGAAWSTDPRLAEIRPEEKPADVLARVWSLWLQASQVGPETGPLALVTHGGPITALLTELGLEPALLAQHQFAFDRRNPLPPAGAWRAVRSSTGHPWSLDLAFTPEAHAARAWLV